MKERIIFNNINVNEEDYQDVFLEWCDTNGCNPEDKDLDDFIQEELNIWLEDEQINLNKPCGNILAIADLGFWNGRKQGYKVINTQKLNGIFDVLGSDYNYFKFYCDRYDVKATLLHHDGTHYITFREIKPNVNIQRLLDKIYNGEEVSQKEITRYTKSLKPLVSKVYGW
jgi:hypothetical protein